MDKTTTTETETMNAKKTTKTTYHRDGTVTYWSVYSQSWVRRAEPVTVPDRELAAMSATERARVLSHVGD